MGNTNCENLNAYGLNILLTRYNLTYLLIFNPQTIKQLVKKQMNHIAKRLKCLWKRTKMSSQIFNYGGESNSMFITQ